MKLNTLAEKVEFFKSATKGSTIYATIGGSGRITKGRLIEGGASGVREDDSDYPAIIIDPEGFPEGCELWVPIEQITAAELMDNQYFTS